ncbi:MAG: amidophosphoribosyltransferase [Bryobacterales bacterium]|nr:amidophosphoribosyltransferase [Bryobacterales bacterium]
MTDPDAPSLPRVPETDDGDRFREECGICAIFGHPEAANLAYLGIYALQHRGQESAGICSSDGRTIRTRKGMGLVSEIFGEHELQQLTGHMAIGHTRYSTAGDIGSRNAQPFYVECNKGALAVAHNGNLTNGHALRAAIEKSGSIFQATSDTEVIPHLMARSRERTLDAALRESLLELEGAYSLALLSNDQVIVARDQRGFRPLAYGTMRHKGRDVHVFASETCAFDLIGAKYQGEVAPGEMVIVKDGKIIRRRFAPVLQPSQCAFEHVYFSRPDSLVFGRSVHKSREALGRILARESPVEADCVVPVPDSGNAAALGFSQESGIPFTIGLIRNHYVGRTFIEPKQSIRNFGVKLKLNPVNHLVEGKRLVLVDDSLVRGTTSRKIVGIMREAGAREVHLRISCPPTIASCYYGVDTPDKDELIANHMSVEQIRQYTGADSLAYLSLAGLKQAVGDNRNGGKYCYSCYTGSYPTELVDVDQFVQDHRQKDTVGSSIAWRSRPSA